mmetsp:Transcript_2647/g.3757  ORF Transcript_2647/g.3757 Transcript_2647/m.3757 type:complete len:307 (+) Transcript_2647:91-1011(+)
MRVLLMVIGLATATGFTVPALIRLRKDGPATVTHKPEFNTRVSSTPWLALASAPYIAPKKSQRRSLALRMAAADEKTDPEAMAKSVESFTELVQKVTGKPDYKFGDLSKGSMERISTTIVSIEEGSIDAMDAIVAKTSSPDYVFGDLTKAAALEVVEWGKKERTAFESLTGKEYEFGDLSRFVATSVMDQAKIRLGPDYQFGDLTKAAAATAIQAVQNYQFGDISRGVLNLFQKAGETVADGVKSAEFGMESVAAARLELLEQEKIMITKVLKKGKAEAANADDMQELLVQEMSYLESLCVKTDIK